MMEQKTTAVKTLTNGIAHLFKQNKVMAQTILVLLLYPPSVSTQLSKNASIAKISFLSHVTRILSGNITVSNISIPQISLCGSAPVDSTREQVFWTISHDHCADDLWSLSPLCQVSLLIPLSSQPPLSVTMCSCYSTLLRRSCTILLLIIVTINPLTSKSDWHVISPYNFTPESHSMVMRIKEMISNN